jgi:hypothetical protein
VLEGIGAKVASRAVASLTVIPAIMPCPLAVRELNAYPTLGLPITAKLVPQAIIEPDEIGVVPFITVNVPPVGVEKVTVASDKGLNEAARVVAAFTLTVPPTIGVPLAVRVLITYPTAGVAVTVNTVPEGSSSPLVTVAAPFFTVKVPLLGAAKMTA